MLFRNKHDLDVQFRFSLLLPPILYEDTVFEAYKFRKDYLQLPGTDAGSDISRYES